jgi:catechol 2,3-dioxygenase-like lactoylglutathione lyase family enzyme
MARIAEVALFTPDVPRMIEFYEQVLGAPPRSRSESHAFFDVGGVTVFIHLATDEAPSGAPNGDHIALAVADQDGLSDALRGLGHDVSGPKQFYWGRSAYVRDPDGRIIELVAETALEGAAEAEA